MLAELLFRFLIGGVLVSAFAMLGDMFKPKSFAGLFGAAPSIALATLGLTVLRQGRPYAAVEAHSMIAGAVGFFLYAYCVSWLMLRRKVRGMVASSFAIVVWAAAAFALWFIWLAKT
jgi:uncharacterized membrane protein (GlpM family)